MVAMSASPAPANRGSGFLTVFGTIFAIPGAAVGISTLQKIVAGTVDVNQAVIGLTLALIFVGAGVGLIVWSRFGAIAAAKLDTVMALEPDRPWLWRDDWAQSYARAEWRSTAGMMVIIGVAFLLFSMPMLMNVQRTAVRRHPFQSSLILLFPGVGLLLVGQSTVTYLRNRKFSDARLRFKGVPCALGGKLEGSVEVDFVLPAGTVVDVKLSSIHSYVSGAGGDRSRWEKVLWQEPRIIAATTDGRTSFVPIAMTIPYDCKPTDTRDPDDAYFWRLTAKAALPGLDFAATFAVPVFETSASDTTLTTAALEARDETELRGERPVQSKIVMRTAPDGGLVFYFGPARNARAAALLTVFAAIFIGSGLFFGFGIGEVFGWIVGAIPLVFSGGIGFLLLLFSLWLWLGVTTVEVSNGALHVKSSCLGLSRSRVIPAASIRDFELASNLQTADHVWYDLKLKLDDGRSVTAGGGLEKQEAEWLRGELKKDLGMGK
jgi:hypothetical protein